MSANLSEMVRRRYPEKEAELAALRDCQMAGVKAGALAFAGVGAGLFGSLRLYARRVSPLALGNAIGVSVSTCGGLEKRGDGKPCAAAKRNREGQQGSGDRWLLPTGASRPGIKAQEANRSRTSKRAKKTPTPVY